jgi:hypothetical protein
MYNIVNGNRICISVLNIIISSPQKYKITIIELGLTDLEDLCKTWKWTVCFLPGTSGMAYIKPISSEFDL